MNHEGIPTKRGNRWFAQTVQDVLESNWNPTKVQTQ